MLNENVDFFPVIEWGSNWRYNKLILIATGNLQVADYTILLLEQ